MKRNTLVSPLASRIAAGILSVLVVASVFAPVLAPYNPNAQGDLVKERLLAPSWQHPFGTDKFARDVFSRVLYGGRVSLLIAVAVVGLSTAIGLVYGGISGYWGGLLDAGMMRFLDLLLAFPAVFLIITLVSLFGANLLILVLVLSLLGWMGMARLVRAEILRLRQHPFLLAEEALGLSPGRILVHHLLPNLMPTVLAVIPVRVGVILLLESALSFLGLGVQPPTASWGSIIQDGSEVLVQAWWVSFFPGMMILISVFCVNIIGEYLRERWAA
ncbi:MAG TPA: ABC transporter permease [Bacteroidetes bacterium]|nr:ABC transporter permease [Bacteroidota bacterium]